MSEPKLQFQAALRREPNTALNQKKSNRPMLFPNEEAFAFSRPQLLSSRHHSHGDHSIATDHFMAFEGEYVIRAPGRVAVEHPARKLHISVAGIPAFAVQVTD